MYKIQSVASSYISSLSGNIIANIALDINIPKTGKHEPYIAEKNTPIGIFMHGLLYGDSLPKKPFFLELSMI